MKKEVSGKLTKIQPYTKENIEDILKRNNLTLENSAGYDCVYVANMCKADFLGSSVIDEPHLARYIKDVIDDPDGECRSLFCGVDYKLSFEETVVNIAL